MAPLTTQLPSPWHKDFRLSLPDSARAHLAHSSRVSTLLRAASYANYANSPHRRAQRRRPEPTPQPQQCDGLSVSRAASGIPVASASPRAPEPAPGLYLPRTRATRPWPPARSPAAPRTVNKCWNALARPRAPLRSASRRAPHPIQSVQILRNSSRCSRATGHVAKHFQFGHQQSPSAMQPRTNRPNRASCHLRCFLVTHFFHPAPHHGLAKLRGQFQYRSPHVLQALALFRPRRRCGRVPQNNSGAGAVFVLLFQRNFPRQSFQVFHYALARHAVQERPERSELGVILFRIAPQRHEHVLHNFFRGPRISRHAQRKAVHGRLVLPVQQREIFYIALGTPPHHTPVRHWLGDPHLPC